MRSELMAAIYDKALKRKDYSGIIDKEKEAEAKDKKAMKAAAAASASGSSAALATSSSTSATTSTPTTSRFHWRRHFWCGDADECAWADKKQVGKTDEKKEGDGGDDPKAGADIGKIVNLMSGDANRVCLSQMLSSHFLCFTFVVYPFG
jgi:hypothetical protein